MIELLIESLYNWTESFKIILEWKVIIQMTQSLSSQKFNSGEKHRNTNDDPWLKLSQLCDTSGSLCFKSYSHSLTSRLVGGHLRWLILLVGMVSTARNLPSTHHFLQNYLTNDKNKTSMAKWSSAVPAILANDPLIKCQLHILRIP